MKSPIFYLALVALALTPLVQAATPMKALIIDGQNNHGMWPKTTVMMKKYLEESGLFTVDVKRTAYTWNGDDLIPQFPVPLDIKTTALKKPKPDPDYAPDFSAYDLVLSNFGWNAAPWPEQTKKGLEDFVSQGGGLVIVHAADNSFAEWDAYNRMIGLGGWGGRDESSGPYVYYDDHGHLVRDISKGRGGSHGKQHEYLIEARDATHPIIRGLPTKWLHAKDELYDQLRGPAEKMHVLATAFADKSTGGSGRHEPILMTIQFGSGRVFHTPMGHADYSMECVGFITTLVRGSEWAATGKVSQTKVPADFPTATEVKKRKFD